MSLSFPNRSRSYDDASKRVRFVGYDGMFEIRFFVDHLVFQKMLPVGLADEAEYLFAFDSMRGTILDVAQKAYAQHRSNMFVFTEADFR